MVITKGSPRAKSCSRYIPELLEERLGVLRVVGTQESSRERTVDTSSRRIARAGETGGPKGVLGPTAPRLQRGVLGSWGKCREKSPQPSIVAV